MDNKELPQEMTYAAAKYTRRFQERSYTEVEMAEDIGKELAQIAQSHYEQIIEAKDTTIKELQAKNEKLTGLLKRTMMLHAGIADLKAGYSADASILEEQWENFKQQHGI